MFSIDTTTTTTKSSSETNENESSSNKANDAKTDTTAGTELAEKNLKAKEDREQTKINNDKAKQASAARENMSKSKTTHFKVNGGVKLGFTQKFYTPEFSHYFGEWIDSVTQAKVGLTECDVSEYLFLK